MEDVIITIMDDVRSHVDEDHCWCRPCFEVLMSNC